MERNTLTETTTVTIAEYAYTANMVNYTIELQRHTTDCGVFGNHIRYGAILKLNGKQVRETNATVYYDAYSAAVVAERFAREIK